MISDHYYFLLDAYDRLGQHLFGSQWTGQEINEHPIRSPKEIEAERAPLEAKITEIAGEIKRHDAAKMKLLKEKDLADNQRTLDDLFEQRGTLQANLWEIGEPTSSYRLGYAAYERRKVTEERILLALQSGEITGAFCGSTNVPNDLWKGTRGFKYYLELSIAAVPRNVSSKRHHAVLISKKEFDRWLGDVIPEVIDEKAPPSPALLCRKLLREQVKKGPKLKTKAAYREEAMTRIVGLSRRQFDIEWSREVSESWKKSGRPKIH